MAPRLHKNNIDVWLLPISDWSVEALNDNAINQLLSEKEHARFQRFKPESKKAEFVASRLLLRHILKTYTDCDTTHTEAIPDDMGRPFWFKDGAPLDLFFSLSHTKEMICCAVSRQREIGCDVESLQPRKYEVDLTERVFSKKEQQFYKDLPALSRSEFFYRSWTLKEAFIKAMGQGLRIPLTSLSFTYLAEKETTFKVSPKHLGDKWTTTAYTFKSCVPSPGYCLGVATPLNYADINIIQAQLNGEIVCSLQ